MPNPLTFNVGPLAAASAVNIFAAATPAAAGALALVGGGPVVLDAARKVLLTFGNENAPRQVKIVGTNVTGNPISETISVPAADAGTLYTEQDFLTVTQVLVYSAWTNNLSIGTNSIASSPWFICDIARNPFRVGYAFWVTGTATYQLECTMDDPNAGYDPTGQDPRYADSIQPLSNVPPLTFPDPVNFSASKSADFQGFFEIPVFALRATLLSGTGSIQFQAVQSGFVGS